MFLAVKTRCPTCGQWLQLPGRAATCPNCGTLVTIPVSTDPPPRVFKDQPGARYEQPPNYIPTRVREMPEWLRATIIIGVIGLLAFSVLFFMIWKVKQPLIGAATPRPVPAPVLKPAPPPSPPATQGSKLFSFEQPPPAEPAAPKDNPPSASPPQQIARATPSTPTPPPPLAPTRPIARTVRPTSLPAAQERAMLTDHAINAAILRGAEHLLARLPKVKDDAQPDVAQGTYALCLHALLYAGQAVSDERLN